MAGDEPVQPKSGARFHFEFDGAVQGFAADTDATQGDRPVLTNVPGGSAAGRRSLRCSFDHQGAASTRMSTPTFIPPSAINMIGYRLLASPTLHAGEDLRATVQLSEDTTGPVEVRLILAHYTGTDELSWLRGPAETLEPGSRQRRSRQVPETGGQPIAEVGVEVSQAGRRAPSTSTG